LPPPLNVQNNAIDEEQALEESSEDEDFRQEFVAQMSNILGLAPPPKPVEARITLLDEAHLVKMEIAHLKSLVDRYRVFASEIAERRQGKED